MRALIVILMVAALVAVPSAASADGGGAYIYLDETYYVAGDTAVVTANAAIPKSRRPMLERGPFYAYVLDGDAWIRAGRPLPPSATRVGTFTVQHDHGWFTFQSRFTMPSLSQGWHHLGFCNDPCTIDGFRESLRGMFSVVATHREGALLAENNRLQYRLAGARHDLSKMERQRDAARRDLADAARMAGQSADRIVELTAQLAAAQQEVAAAGERSDTEHRAALILAVEFAVGLLALLVVSRRRRQTRPAVAVT